MSTYKMPFNQYKHLQKMSKNEFSRWCERFGKNMWEQGYQDAHKGMQEYQKMQESLTQQIQ